MRLQRSRFAEKEQDAAPLGSFPGDMRLNEKDVGHKRAKTAQRCNKPELADLFAQTEIKVRAAKMQLLMRGREIAPRPAAWRRRTKITITRTTKCASQFLTVKYDSRRAADKLSV